MLELDKDFIFILSCSIFGIFPFKFFGELKESTAEEILKKKLIFRFDPIHTNSNRWCVCRMSHYPYSPKNDFPNSRWDEEILILFSFTPSDKAKRKIAYFLKIFKFEKDWNALKLLNNIFINSASIFILTSILLTLHLRLLRRKTKRFAIKIIWRRKDLIYFAK